MKRSPMKKTSIETLCAKASSTASILQVKLTFLGTKKEEWEKRLSSIESTMAHLEKILGNKKEAECLDVKKMVAGNQTAFDELSQEIADMRKKKLNPFEIRLNKITTSITKTLEDIKLIAEQEKFRKEAQNDLQVIQQRWQSIQALMGDIEKVITNAKERMRKCNGQVNAIFLPENLEAGIKKQEKCYRDNKQIAETTASLPARPSAQFEERFLALFKLSRENFQTLADAAHRVFPEAVAAPDRDAQQPIGKIRGSG